MLNSTRINVSAVSFFLIYMPNRQLTYKVGDRVFVYMPAEVEGWTRKFAPPIHGPYRILDLIDTNASVFP